MQNSLDVAEQIAERVADAGGRAYFVGGFVRDRLMGNPGKDIDLEIHGVSRSALEAILDAVGDRLEYGRSFGIYSLRGCDIDVALPRRERLCGSGHRAFDVEIDPFIGAEKAASRRDFTINAMMEDVLSGEILDPFGGREDLRAGILRHVCDDTFPEDPLRVLRCAQFAARFRFTPAPETIALCRTMDVSSLSCERVYAEMEKALLRADRPSIFFTCLRDMEQLDVWFPEVKALIGVQQNPRYHGEGDVFQHTMLVLNEAAALRERAEYPGALMLAALAHDFGKAICTEIIDGNIRSTNHEILGLPLAEAFLRRLTSHRELTENVLNLIRLHMRPSPLAQENASVKATNRLFEEALHPADLILLSCADCRGQILSVPRMDAEPFLRERYALYRQRLAQPCVTGKDLVAAGLKPGEDFGELLALARKLQLAGISREDALPRVLGQARAMERERENALHDEKS